MSESDFLDRLSRTIQQRQGQDPATSYVAKLHAKGLDGVLKKIGEEATETVLAARDGDREHLVSETADLWFHSIVMLGEFGLTANDVVAELERRFGTSGVDEKASRDSTS
jgi:phosphoribosyl-ATP pyrophosphohydrolase